MASIFDKENRLIQAICDQEIVKNNREAAEKLSRKVTRNIYRPGDIILNQQNCTDEMYFILSGILAVQVNERTIAYRSYRQAVGEMCLVDVGGVRSATITVHEESELARIEAADFIDIADSHHPVLWKNIAQSLARRLRERNGRERSKNLIPRVFIASSSESKEIIDCISNNLLSTSVELIPWTRPGLFQPSTHTIETLEKSTKEVDFAIILITPDDVIRSRKEEFDAPRDNVVFETGLFMGALERRRVFMLESTETKIKIPSDLSGLTTMRYKNSEELAEICKQIAGYIAEYGTI